MKRAALYIRVSTLEQAQEGYSIGAQKERLLAFCKAHDWLVADFYIDIYTPTLIQSDRGM